jgi:hypothetical protein
MIIKIHSRGIGAGRGPIDYLLGKDRDRQDARLDRGDPEQMIQIIDSTNFAQKYTSGVLSFAERDLDEQQKQQIDPAVGDVCNPESLVGKEFRVSEEFPFPALGAQNA